MTFLERLQTTWEPRLFSVSRSLAPCLAHGRINSLTCTLERKINSLLSKPWCPSPSPPISQLWKSLNTLFVVLQPFAFKLGVSLSHFISYSSYQPCEVSAVICAFQARARRGERSNLPARIAQRAWGRRGICAPRLRLPACLGFPHSPLALNLIMKCGFSVLHFENHVKGINS